MMDSEVMRIIDQLPVERAAILDLQSALLAGVEAGDLVEERGILEHVFSEGLYTRRLFMPAGAVIVGKIHRFAHTNIITHGIVHVATEFGRITYDASAAPVTFVSEPGTKRALYVEKDVFWYTLHPTDKTDLDEIEEYLIAPSYEELQKVRYIDIKGEIQ